MLGLWLMISPVLFALAFLTYFGFKYVCPLKVWNRPGYWMALRWARWFAWQAIRGRVDTRRQSGALIWEAWPDSERWHYSTHIPLTLIWNAICGARFRMDQTEHMTAMEIWPDDQ